MSLNSLTLVGDAAGLQLRGHILHAESVNNQSRSAYLAGDVGERRLKNLADHRYLGRESHDPKIQSCQKAKPRIKVKGRDGLSRRRNAFDMFRRV